VLDGKVRAGSRYREGGRLSIHPDVPYDVLRQARQHANRWLPADFIVMDLAVLPGNQTRIVEFNSVHTSGLYAIEPLQFMEVVRDAVRRRAFGSRGDAVRPPPA